MAGNQIPTKQRDLLAARCGGHCEVCGGPAHQYHHRRRRNVKTHDPHCACNALALCNTCHDRAHANPDWAKARGIIVSPYQDNPGTIPVNTYRGWMRFECDGGLVFTDHEGRKVQEWR